MFMSTECKRDALTLMPSHWYHIDWHDGIVVSASALQSVDLDIVFLVKLCQKTFKNAIHSFSAWHSAQKR